MHANRHSLKLFGILGAVFFTAAPASAQCTDQWLPGEGLPGLDGDVYAAAVYDDGTGPTLYVGGNFNFAGEVFANNIAKWDGANWSALGSGISSSVYALTVYDGELIAGGISPPPTGWKPTTSPAGTANPGRPWAAGWTGALRRGF